MDVASRRSGSRFAVLLCIFCLPAWGAASHPLCATGPAPLSPSQAREDISLATDAAEAALPDIYWHQTRDEWNAAKAAALSSVTESPTDDAVIRAVRVLLYQVGEGHMSVRANAAMTCRYNASPLFPLDVLWRDDGLFVVAGYGEASDLPKGAEILSINGQSHAELLEEMFRANPHDGVIRTGVMRDEGANYAAACWRLHGTESLFHLQWKDPEGNVFDRDVPPVPHNARPKAGADPDPAARLTWVDDSTAYLYVPTFSNKRYRAVGADYVSTLQSIFDQLRDKKAKQLILDLRDNGGGTESNEKLLFSYLVETPVQEYAYVRSRANILTVKSLSGRIYRQRIYDASELSTVRAHGTGYLDRLNAPPLGLMTGWHSSSPVFGGRLVVLTSGSTFSGAAELASLLRATRRGIFVGEEVGGTHAGNTSGYKWEITLPHSGVEIGIPLLAFRFAWADPAPNHGVIPDYKVQPTVWDRRVENDAAYQTAIGLLTGGSRQPPVGVASGNFQLPSSTSGRGR